KVAEHVRRWGHVRLFSPFGMNCTSLGRSAIQSELPGEGDLLTGREYLAAYLEPLAKTSLLAGCLRLETQVLQLGRAGMGKEEQPGNPLRGRQPFRLLVREGKSRERVEEADVVLDCTGTYGQHRWLGDGGIPAAGELAAEGQIAYGLEDVL